MIMDVTEYHGPVTPSLATSDEWERALGRAVRASRLAADLDQVSLAERADVSVGALKNLESGKGSSVRTLVKVVRALGRDEWLQALSPPVAVSPIAALAQVRRNRQVRSRRRVSPRREGGAG